MSTRTYGLKGMSTRDWKSKEKGEWKRGREGCRKGEKERQTEKQREMGSVGIATEHVMIHTFWRLSGESVAPSVLYFNRITDLF